MFQAINLIFMKETGSNLIEEILFLTIFLLTGQKLNKMLAIQPK